MNPKHRPRRTLGELIASIPFIRVFVNNAFRVEDSIKRFRMRRARERGHLEVVETYTGIGSNTRVRVLGRVQMIPAALRRTGRRRFPTLLLRRNKEQLVRGWRSFVRVAVPYSQVTVHINGSTHQFESDRGGIIDQTIEVNLEPGWHTIHLESVDGQISEAPVFIKPKEQRYGIVSDIDDTVMVTSLPRPLLAAWNTFVLDEHARVAVPGMNVLYQRLVSKFGQETTPVVYLSTGSWNVAPTLNRFLGRNLYPFGPLLLTDWGPVPQRLFRSGTDHKRANLRRLAEDFPDVKWLLIGDDGQHDEKLYGEFARDFPDSVLAIAIRQLSNTESVLAGGRASTSARWRRHHRNVPWVHGPNGAKLIQELARIGILDPDPAAAELVGLSESLANTSRAVPFPPAEVEHEYKLELDQAHEPDHASGATEAR
ncbi:App1 family protein [Gulosibacter molinativorax]|nr:phosphatase domain-containing protein [Gulosibacter molinativorax]